MECHGECVSKYMSDSVCKLVIRQWILYDLLCFLNVRVSSKFRIRHHFIQAGMGKLSVIVRNRILSLWSSGVEIQKIICLKVTFVCDLCGVVYLSPCFK